MSGQDQNNRDPAAQPWSEEPNTLDTAFLVTAPGTRS